MEKKDIGTMLILIGFFVGGIVLLNVGFKKSETETERIRRQNQRIVGFLMIALFVAGIVLTVYNSNEAKKHQKNEKAQKTFLREVSQIFFDTSSSKQDSPSVPRRLPRLKITKRNK